MVAGGFALLSLIGIVWMKDVDRKWHGLSIMAMAAWAVFGWNEGEMLQKNMNIRLDMLLLAPAMYLVTFTGFVPWLRFVEIWRHQK